MQKRLSWKRLFLIYSVYMTDKNTTDSYGHDEPHASNVSGRSNWLRAAVLGANDGIVSTAGLVVGVAGATSSKIIILTAGLAGIIVVRSRWRPVSTSLSVRSEISKKR
jgi:hypothetical protein